ncbi:hypothetical protein FCM35_KLT13577 [Carex littledalei]|uniref:Uncharacterized protein n=1 Tax=Carex littledalei TaxID=544730 RepID=A0A833V1C0_9POAL|nr:hypothetical protein FCM35_KLT13577 [Carex littledalei]
MRLSSKSCSRKTSQPSQELQTLRHDIGNFIQLRTNQQASTQDGVRWKSGKDGKFTFRSAYYEMKMGLELNQMCIAYGSSRRLRDTKVFEWLLHSNRILTTDNLKRRGYNMPGICYM